MSLFDRVARTGAVAVEIAPGLGDGFDDPLVTLLADPTVDEVLVNGPTRIWVERRGRLEATGLRFADTEALRDACVRLAARAGRRLDDAEPMVDARLLDGSRMHAVLPPLAPDGPLLAVRRFGRVPLSLADLVARGSLQAEDAALLDDCVASRRSIVVSGGTSTGKTTLLAALAGRIEPSQRIVTVEDAAELRIDRPNVARLESRPPNLEGRGGVDVRSLVRAALRMRPDRLIVGEVRGAEALDMLQAMNTGHEGSLTTVHANGAEDALRRIETLALMAGLDLPLAAIREQLASAVQVVVQLGRHRDGSRCLEQIAGVLPDGERGWRLVDRAALRASLT